MLQSPSLNAPARCQPSSRIDRTITLVVLAILVAGVYLVLQPFLSAIAWAAILVATTWPVFHWMVSRAGPPGGRGDDDDAADPHGRRRAVRDRRLDARGERRSPGRIRARRHRARPAGAAGSGSGSIPLVGERASAYWASFAHDTGGLARGAPRFVEPLRAFAFRAGAVVGEGLLQLTLSVLIAFFFYRDGEAIMARVRAAVTRISPDARRAHARRGGRDDARGGVRHPRHRARAGRADGDRPLHRRLQGGAAARAW